MVMSLYSFFFGCFFFALLCFFCFFFGGVINDKAMLFQQLLKGKASISFTASAVS